MKKKVIPDCKLYDIIPSQETMYLMIKFSFHKQLIQIPTSFTIDKEYDIDLMKKAIEIEFQRNDSLRLEYFKVDGKIKQHFRTNEEFKLDEIHVKNFASLEEQEAFFAEDAQKPILFLKGQTYRIYLFKTEGAGNGIYFNVTHMNLDAMGVVIFYFDLLKVYNALKDGTEMPAPLASFEEYVNEEFARLADKKKMAKHEAFYRDYFLKGGEPYYAAVHGPEFLEKERKKKKDPDRRCGTAYNPIYDKCDTIVKHIDPETSKKIFDFCIERKMAPESLLELGLRTHCSAINYRIDDVFLMSMCSKRATNKEKNMGGCVTQPLQVRTIIPESFTFEQALNEFTSTRTKLFRHSTYPYTALREMTREMFNFGMVQAPACLMFSWIPVPIVQDLPFKIDFRTYNLGRYFSPLYVITSPDPKDMGINMNYMYRVKLSTAQHIEDLHQNALKVVLAGIENPNITIGELLDSIS